MVNDITDLTSPTVSKPRPSKSDAETIGNTSMDIDPSENVVLPTDLQSVMAFYPLTSLKPSNNVSPIFKAPLQYLKNRNLPGEMDREEYQALFETMDANGQDQTNLENLPSATHIILQKYLNLLNSSLTQASQDVPEKIKPVLRTHRELLETFQPKSNAVPVPNHAPLELAVLEKFAPTTEKFSQINGQPEAKPAPQEYLQRFERKHLPKLQEKFEILTSFKANVASPIKSVASPAQTTPKTPSQSTPAKRPRKGLREASSSEPEDVKDTDFEDAPVKKRSVTPRSDIVSASEDEVKTPSRKIVKTKPIAPIIIKHSVMADPQQVVANAIEYVNGIFDEEDQLDSMDTDEPDTMKGDEVNGKGLHLHHFDVTDGQPCLNASTLTALSKHIERVVEVKKMGDFADGLEGGRESLMKLYTWLDNRIKEAEVTSLNISFKKREDDEEEEEQVSPREKILKLTLSMQAANIALNIFHGGVGVLDKRFYPEDMIKMIVGVVKDHLNHSIYRAIDQLMNHSDTPLKKHQDKLTLLSHALADCLSTMGKLFEAEKFDEGLIIDALPAAVGPFVVPILDGGKESKSKMLGLDRLQVSSMNLVRTIFARYPAQRFDIFTELFTGLVKVPSGKQALRKYQLPNGNSVNMWSALVVGCLQSCCAMPETWVDMEQEVRGWLTGERQESRKKGETSQFDRLLAVLSNNLSVVIEYARWFLTNLRDRAFPLNALEQDSEAEEVQTGPKKKKKKENLANEEEYRHLFREFCQDIRTLLDEPDWPAAELCVLLCSKILAETLDDGDKASHVLQARLMALDQLASIATRLCQRHLLVKEDALTWELQKLWPKEEAKEVRSIQDLDTLWSAQRALEAYLWVCRTQDSNFGTARLFHATMWAQAVLQPLAAHIDGKIELKPEFVINCRALLLDQLDLLTSVDPTFRHRFYSIKPENDFNKRLMEGLSEPVLRTITPQTQEGDLILNDADLMHRLVSLMASSQPLSMSFESILHKITHASTSNATSLRKEAMKGLHLIIDVDPTILTNKIVRRTLELSLVDSGISVREKGVETLSKFAAKADNIEVTREYLDVMLIRMQDKGTSVRKRALGYLKDAYNSLSLYVERKHYDDPDLRKRDVANLITMATHFFIRMTYDEEETIQQLAEKSLISSWFAPFSNAVKVPKAHDGPPIPLAQYRMDMDYLPLDVDVADLQTVELDDWNIGSLGLAAQREIMARVNVISGTNRQLRHHALSNCHSEDFNALGNFLETLIRKEPRYKAWIRVWIDAMIHQLPTLEGNHHQAHEELKEITQRYGRDNCLEARQMVAECSDREVLAGQELTDWLETLYQLARACPRFFAPHITVLSAFLRVPDGFINTASMATSVALTCQILAACLPYSGPLDTNTQTVIARELQNLIKTLHPHSLVSVVSCLVVLVAHHLKNYSSLAKMVISTMSIVRKWLESLKRHESIPEFVFYRAMFISSTCMLDVDFDHLRKTSWIDVAPQAVDELNRFCPTSLRHRLLHDLSEIAKIGSPSQKAVAISSMGRLCKLEPRQLAEDEVRDVMTKVFKSGESIVVKNLLEWIRDFLKIEQVRARKAEQKKKEEGPKKVDYKVLTGTSEELGDAGVSGSVMQTFIQDILNCMTGIDDNLRSVSLEIVRSSCEQGLFHPITAIPALVALETCTSTKLNNLAISAKNLHQKMAEKFPDVVNMKNFECVKAAYQFQLDLAKYRHETAVQMEIQNLQGDPEEVRKLAEQKVDPVQVYGYIQRSDQVVAVLQTFYEIIKAKKPNRYPFLFALVKIFDADLRKGVPVEVVNVDFGKFVGENLATFDYHYQEELLSVLHIIHKILGTNGTTVAGFYESLERFKSTLPEPEAIQKAEDEMHLSLKQCAEASKKMSMLLILREHLQRVYKVKENRIVEFGRKNVGKNSSDHTVGDVKKIAIAWDRVTLLDSKLTNDQTRSAMLSQFNALMQEFNIGDFDGMEDFHASGTEGKEEVVKPKTKRKSTGQPAKSKRQKFESSETEEEARPVKKKPKVKKVKKKKVKKTRTDSEASSSSEEDDSDVDPSFA